MSQWPKFEVLNKFGTIMIEEQRHRESKFNSANTEMQVKCESQVNFAAVCTPHLRARQTL